MNKILKILNFFVIRESGHCYDAVVMYDKATPTTPLYTTFTVGNNILKKVIDDYKAMNEIQKEINRLYDQIVSNASVFRVDLENK